jgi:hypothetical protein
MKPLVLAALLLAALLPLYSGCSTTRSASAAADTRTLWVYEDGTGSFSHAGKDLWIETNPDIRRDAGHFEFKEASRTPEYVVLFDASRNLTVRLSADRMEWRQGEEDAWKCRYHGSWKTQSG